jgi:hypothetical protein
VTVSSVASMRESFFDSTYGVMSKIHFCDANSAVQITSA